MSTTSKAAMFSMSSSCLGLVPSTEATFLGHLLGVGVLIFFRGKIVGVSTSSVLLPPDKYRMQKCVCQNLLLINLQNVHCKLSLCGLFAQGQIRLTCWFLACRCFSPIYQEWLCSLEICGAAHTVLQPVFSWSRFSYYYSTQEHSKRNPSVKQRRIVNILLLRLHNIRS